MSVVHIAAVSQDWDLIIQLAHAIGFMDGIPDKTISRFHQSRGQRIYRPLGYERVYLPLYKVADTPFHTQGDDMCTYMSDNIYLIL